MNAGRDAFGGNYVATKRLLQDRENRRKTFEMAGRRTFQMQADFWPAVRHLHTYMDRNVSALSMLFALFRNF
jgi:hypothetical protein